MPEPLLPVAIVAKSKADEDKLSQALARLVAEDPTLRLEINPETHQLVLWCMGEAHADVLLDRLGHRYGVAVETVDAAGAAARDDRRQGPGPGPERQADRRARRVRHLPHRGRAAGRTRPASSSSTRSSAAWCRASSSRRWRRASGAQMEQGVLAGYPMTGVRVTLYDGKAHSVDSSDMAFQKAGRAGAEGRRGQGPADAARAGRRGRRCWCPTTTSAR